MNYTLEKNPLGEATCRACFWREWAVEARGHHSRAVTVPHDVALEVADTTGYLYLAPLTEPSLPDDPHRVQCRHCQRISAGRLSDIAFGCPCRPRHRDRRPAPPRSRGRFTLAGYLVHDIHGLLRTDRKAAKDWLDNSTVFTSQPWEELARVYDRNGQPADARCLR